MFCANCGTELEDDAVFCYNCGAAVGSVEEEGDASAGVTDGQAASPAYTSDQPVPPEYVSGQPVPSQYVPGQEVPPEYASGQPIPPAYAPETTDQAPRRKSKKLLAVLAAVAGAAAVAGIAAALVMNSPRNVVLRSFKNTAKAIASEETGVAGYLGLNDLIKTVVEGKSRQKLSVEVDLDALGYGDVSGTVGAALTLDKNADQEIYMNAVLSGGGASWMLAELYLSEKEAMASVPMLSENSLYIAFNTLKEMAENGDLFDQLEDTYGITMDRADQKQIQEFLADEQENKFDAQELATKYVKYSAETWKDLYKAIEVEKTKARKFKVGGKDKSCKGYTVMIPSDSIEDLAENFCDFLEAEALPYLEDMDMLTGRSSNYSSEIKNMKKNLKIRDDVEFDVYVGPKTRMVCLQADIDSSDLEVRLLGAKNPADQLEITVDDTEISREVEEKDDKITDEIVVDSSYYSNSVKLTVDKKKQEWELEITDGSATNFAEGSLEDVKKGSGVTVIIEDIGRERGNNSEYLADSGLANITYSLAKTGSLGDGDLRKMPKLDLLTATEDDIEDLMDELQDSLGDLVDDLTDTLDIDESIVNSLVYEIMRAFY